jgi:hypothetical protein
MLAIEMYILSYVGLIEWRVSLIACQHPCESGTQPGSSFLQLVCVSPNHILDFRASG